MGDVRVGGSQRTPCEVLCEIIVLTVTWLRINCKCTIKNKAKDGGNKNDT